jgi:cytochrome d ubiquinol oxidase subunit II
MPALIWGLVLAGQLGGIPIDRAGDFIGGPLDLLRPYALVGALAFAVLFFLYGSVFLCLRTTGPVAERARQLTGRVWVVALVAVGAFLAWTFAGTSGGRAHGALSIALPVASFIALALILILHRARREALAFAATGIAILCLVSTLFLALFPRVMVSSVSASFSLTVAGASSSPYALGVMSVGAVIFAPVVLVYEGWAYWVFRKRVTSAPMDTRA